MPALAIGAAVGIFASAWVSPALAAVLALVCVLVVARLRLLDHEWKR